MIIKIYRTIIPFSLRDKIYSLFLGDLLLILRNLKPYLKGKSVYFFSFLFPKNDYYDAFRFIGKHGISFHAFPAALSYNDLPIKVLYDEAKCLPYVYHSNKKLYFPQNMEEENIISLYRSLVLEQDSNSPHRYVDSYDELKGMFLLDIGAAEGIFSLEVIELVEKTHLFECDEKWIKALHATFEPWKEKVLIVEKYISDINNEEFTTIDSFMEEKENNNLFIKMDIEGYEQSALRGARQTLDNGQNVVLSVCTYHRPNDAKEISFFLNSIGYQYSFTKGYLFCGKQMNRAVCRAKKSYKDLTGSL